MEAIPSHQEGNKVAIVQTTRSGPGCYARPPALPAVLLCGVGRKEEWRQSTEAERKNAGNWREKIWLFRVEEYSAETTTYDGEIYYTEERNGNKRTWQAECWLPHDHIVTVENSGVKEVGKIWFITDSWLKKTIKCAYTTTALVDIIGTKEDMRSGRMKAKTLCKLTKGIDSIAKKYQDEQIEFVSASDTIAVIARDYLRRKDRKHHNAAEPDTLMKAIHDIAETVDENLKRECCVTVAQGPNAYGTHTRFHRRVENHVGLNILNVGLARAQYVERAARRAYKERKHSRGQMYVEAGATSWFGALLPEKARQASEREEWDYRDPFTGRQRQYIVLRRIPGCSKENVG